MCRENFLTMIPEAGCSDQQTLLPRRLVQLPNTLATCPSPHQDTEKKPRDDDEECDPAQCATPPPNEEIPGSNAQQESENLRKAKKVVASRCKKYVPPGQSYTAINVRAINRNSENLAHAQKVNIKEDKRLSKKLTSIDRERTVFKNSITRDEKLLLSRSKALATVLLKRTSSSIPRPSESCTPTNALSIRTNQLQNIRANQLSNGTTALSLSNGTTALSLSNGTAPMSSGTAPMSSSTTPLSNGTNPLQTTHTNPLSSSAPARRMVSCPVKATNSKAEMMYGEEPNKFVPTKRSRTANIKRVRLRTVSSESTDPDEKAPNSSNNTESCRARLRWANSVNTIMKRDIKTWHKAFLVWSPRQKSTSSLAHQPVPPTSSTGKTPTMPEIVADKSMVSNPVVREPLDSKSISKLLSNEEIDKGAWITNYINTSCAEHFPII